MIKFENVSKVYPNGTRGLEDVNLEIQQGEFIGIIGTSGAGKSTLIRTINGLNNVTEGTLMVNETNVAQLKGKALREFRKNVGLRRSLGNAAGCERGRGQMCTELCRLVLCMDVLCRNPPRSHLLMCRNFPDKP